MFSKFDVGWVTDAACHVASVSDKTYGANGEEDNVSK